LKNGRGPEESFILGNEFASIHLNGTCHVSLPPPIQQEVIDKGWGERHPMGGILIENPHGGHKLGIPATCTLLFAPRDEEELRVVLSIVDEGYKWALGPSKQSE